MEFRMIYLYLGISMLLLSTSLADTNSDQNSQDVESEARLLSRLQEAVRQKVVAPEAAVREELQEEKETVERIDDHRTKIDVTVGDELIERHVVDCKLKYEIIMLNDGNRHKKPKACYLHYMDDKLYASTCLGDKETLHQAFTTVEEIVNKDFLSEDGPDSVCRGIPMYMTVNTVDVDQDNTSSRRGLNVDKKSKNCRTSCAFECRGWWNCPWVCHTKCS